jgi:hypothetical protein
MFTRHKTVVKFAQIVLSGHVAGQA